MPSPDITHAMIFSHFTEPYRVIATGTREAMVKAAKLMSNDEFWLMDPHNEWRGFNLDDEDRLKYTFVTTTSVMGHVYVLRLDHVTDFLNKYHMRFQS